MAETIIECGYKAVAESLKEFGYPDTTPKMIEEIHKAMKAGAELPFGVIGMMAEGQINDYPSIFNWEAPHD